MPTMTNYKPEDITPSMRKYLGVPESAQDDGTSEGAKKGWETRKHGTSKMWDRNVIDTFREFPTSRFPKKIADGVFRAEGVDPEWCRDLMWKHRDEVKSIQKDGNASIITMNNPSDEEYALKEKEKIEKEQDRAQSLKSRLDDAYGVSKNHGFTMRATEVGGDGRYFYLDNNSPHMRQIFAQADREAGQDPTNEKHVEIIRRETRKLADKLDSEMKSKGYSTSVGIMPNGFYGVNGNFGAEM